MAQIKDLAVGDGFVCLMENGVKTKFYLLAHDYESGLNGTGRALFVRESPVRSGTWSSISGSSYVSYLNNSCGWGDSKWDTVGLGRLYCNIYNYLNTTYLNLFSSDVQEFIGKTKYYSYTNAGTHDRGKCMSTTSAVFTVSARESIQNFNSTIIANACKDGTLLSYAARKRLEQIFTAYGSSIWTRTPSVNYNNRDSDDHDNEYFYSGVKLTGVSSSEWGVFSYKDGILDRTDSAGYLPCFTLPETLYVTDEGFATVNQPPELTSTAGKSGTDLGEKNAPFALSYTVTDKDGDTMTVTEKLDGVEKAVHTGVASGTTLSVAWLSQKDGFQQIVNGSHTLTIAVDDSKNTVEWKVTFAKITTTATIRMTTPMTSDSAITVAAMTLEGTFPADALLTVEMTNNGLDTNPVWEKCTDIQTSELKAFVHHTFTNTTAAKGFAFNYRVTISRSANGTGGNITMIGGTFA